VYGCEEYIVGYEGTVTLEGIGLQLKHRFVRPQNPNGNLSRS
jgi:hypothetical protein